MATKIHMNDPQTHLCRVEFLAGGQVGFDRLLVKVKGEKREKESTKSTNPKKKYKKNKKKNRRFECVRKLEREELGETNETSGSPVP